MSLVIVTTVDDVPVPTINDISSFEVEVVDLELWVDYIFLDADERRRFAQVSHEYLISQVQSHNYPIGPDINQFQLRFNHPCKELMWFIHQPDFGQDLFAVADTPEDTIYYAKLILNNSDREKQRESTYYRCVIPYSHHEGGYSQGLTVDTDGINEHQGGFYLYSFAIKPDEHQPSGTCNFSRIDNAVLLIKLNPSVSLLSTAYIYATNYNVLRIMSGMGGLAYSN